MCGEAPEDKGCVRRQRWRLNRGATCPSIVQHRQLQRRRLVNIIMLRPVIHTRTADGDVITCWRVSWWTRASWLTFGEALEDKDVVKDNSEVASKELVPWRHGMVWVIYFVVAILCMGPPRQGKQRPSRHVPRETYVMAWWSHSGELGESKGELGIPFSLLGSLFSSFFFTLTNWQFNDRQHWHQCLLVVSAVCRIWRPGWISACLWFLFFSRISYEHNPQILRSHLTNSCWLLMCMGGFVPAPADVMVQCWNVKNDRYVLVNIYTVPGFGLWTTQ